MKKSGILAVLAGVGALGYGIYKMTRKEEEDVYLNESTYEYGEDDANDEVESDEE